MPTRKLKDLAWRDFEELNKSWELKLTTNQFLAQKKLLESTDKLYVTAEKYYDDGDEENAYRLYMRFLQVCIFLPKLKDYDKKFVSARLSKRASVAQQRTEELSESLCRRYDLKSEAKARLELEAADSGKEEKTSVKVPNVINTDTSAESKSKDLEKLNILPKELFEWIKTAQKSFLIVDIRSSEDFQSASFLTPNVVNVPLEKVTPGLTAVNIEEFLRGDSRQLFKQRHKLDYLVLSDYHSDLSDLAQKSSIQIVSDALFVYDSVGKLKNRPIILTGGFNNWVMYYPSYCTNIRENIRPMVPKTHSDDSFNSATVIQYPSLIIKEPEPSASAINGQHYGKIESHTDSTVETVEENASIAYPKLPADSELFDRLSRLRLAPEKPDITLPSPLDLEKSVRQDISRPSVPDRKLKPAGGLDSSVSNNGVSDAKSRDPSPTPPIKREIQDDGEYVSVKLPEMDISRKVELEAENERLRKELAEKDAEIRRKQDVENLRRQRKMLEKQNGQSDSSLEGVPPINKPVPLPRTHVTVDEPAEGLEAQNPTISLPPKPEVIVAPKPILSDAETTPVPTTNSKSSEKVTLKTPAATADIGEMSGLKRSVSSPNIAKLIAEKMEVDKTSEVKPARNLPPKFHNPTFQVTKEQPIFGIPLDFYTKFVMKRKATLQGYEGCKGRFLTGLRNLGNTCFMNSILQCLSNTQLLSNYFCSGTFLQHINQNNKMGHKGMVALEFSVVMSSLASGTYRWFAPTAFRETVSKCKPEFGGYDQQDSQEFLNFLLDSLHEDLNGAVKVPVQEQDNDNLKDREAACKSWQSHLIHNSSIFVNLFQGQYKSTVECLSCGHQSRTFDTFMFLSVPVLRQSCRLTECIAAYLQPELMSGNSQYKCPKCKDYRDAKKFIQLWKLPQILFIHFKRFQWEGQWRSKINALVDFPISNLDMGPYVIGETPPARYNLYAISHHTGNLEGGHYTAMCKNQQSGNWYLYDDQDVREMSPSNLKSSGAYILCYSYGN